MVELSIINGDLGNMRTYDLSSLNGLLNVCSAVTVTQEGIHLEIGDIHIAIFESTLVFVDKWFMYDEIIISYDIFSNGIMNVNFTVSNEDSEVYFYVVQDR